MWVFDTEQHEKKKHKKCIVFCDIISKERACLLINKCYAGFLSLWLTSTFESIHVCSLHSFKRHTHTRNFYWDKISYVRFKLMLTRLWTNVINNNLTTNFFSAVSSFQLHIIDSLDERREREPLEIIFHSYMPAMFLNLCVLI